MEGAAGRTEAMADGIALTNTTEPADTHSGVGRFYPWYVVVLLTAVSVVGYIDRQVINILVEPIKRSFEISDTQISLLQGLAFMVAYMALAPLYGRLVDTRSRKAILVTEVGLWSVFTALCGTARSYAQIFGARFGVGAMEAGLFPCSWSLIADTVPRRHVPRAFSIYLMTPYIGGGLALLLGAMLLDMGDNGGGLVMGLEPWRAVFILLGLPGIALALILFLTLREPPRTQMAPDVEEAPAPRFRDAVRQLMRRVSFYGNFFAGMACIVVSIYAIPAWGPAMLARTYGVAPAVIGKDYGILTIIAGSIGVLSGPSVASMLRRIGVKQSIAGVAVVGALGLAACDVALMLGDTYSVALAAVGVAVFFSSLPQAMAATAIQVATPPHLRGLASSFYIVTVTLIGLGIGPTGVAMMTDYVFADPHGVRWSLPIISGLAALVAVPLLLRAAATGAIVEEESR